MKDSRAVSAIIEELKNLYPDASCSLECGMMGRR